MYQYAVFWLKKLHIYGQSNSHKAWLRNSLEHRECLCNSLENREWLCNSLQNREWLCNSLQNREWLCNSLQNREWLCNSLQNREWLSPWENNRLLQQRLWNSPQTETSKISSFKNIHLRCKIIWKFCTEHSSDTAMLCENFDMIGQLRNKFWTYKFSWDFEFKMSFRGISYIKTATDTQSKTESTSFLIHFDSHPYYRAPSQYKDRLIYVWRFPC